MKPGRKYTWTVSSDGARPDRPRALVFHPAGSTKKMVDDFNFVEAEDRGTRFFRIAFLLEERQFLADAYLYYKRAVHASPGMNWYREKLDEFESDFQLGKYRQ